MDNIQTIKQRFGIIGINDSLNRALEKALRVASTNISVLVTGESGVGKENIPKIIHQYSNRKHSKYIAVNCGAIPEGTIDSELFGHEKGAFTGATSTRSGYFEVADGGTIFLDEVGELPLPTQVRLLRILENGEFLKVGSSKVQKTDVRIVAATNIQMIDAIQKGKFTNCGVQHVQNPFTFECTLDQIAFVLTLKVIEHSQLTARARRAHKVPTSDMHKEPARPGFGLPGLPNQHRSVLCSVCVHTHIGVWSSPRSTAAALRA